MLRISNLQVLACDAKRQGRRAMSRDAPVLETDGQGKINPEVFEVAAS